MDISEKSFEQTIEDTLIFSLPAEEGSIADSTPNFTNFTPGGYRKCKPEHYDRHLCLDPNTVLDFIYATQDKIYPALSPVVDRFNEAEKEEQVDFRHFLNNYIRLYAFLSQVITFIDADLEKLYLFARLLIRYLHISREELPKEIQQNIDMDSYRLQKTGNGKIELERGKPDIEPIGPKSGHSTTLEELEPLSQIIEELNELFGTEFTREDKVFIIQLEEKLIGDPALEASVRVNPPKNARLTFDHVVNDRLQEMIDSNFKFYHNLKTPSDREGMEHNPIQRVL